MTKLAVLLDATPLPPERGGVGRYVEELVRELAHRNLALTVVCHESDRELFQSLGVEVVTAPASIRSTVRRLLWEQMSLPRLAKKLGASVIHSIHYTSPLFTRIPRVITIHDLTFYSHPQFHSTLKRFFFRTWLRLSAGRGRTLIAVSHTTAMAWKARFPRASSHIVVAPLGKDEKRFHLPTGTEIQSLGNTLRPAPESWIAFLGTLEPRKNVPALIRGYMKAVGQLPAADRPALLLAGGQGWDTGVDSALHDAHNAGLDVRKLGYLPLEQLSAFLGAAELVVYPSFGEGFGLPVLEAMATGAAVLTTRNLSLPEVGGDAVFYTDTDPESIGSAIVNLLAHPEKRRQARTRASERAAHFSWTTTAAKTEMAYRQAAGIV